MGFRLFNRFGLFFAFFGFVFFADAQQFSGSNEPGGKTNFTFNIVAPTTNWTLPVPGTTNAYSYLYVKKGTGASATNYTYSAQLTGRTNVIALEIPEAIGTWSVSVSTPLESETHAFTATVKKNVLGIRALQPLN